MALRWRLVIILKMAFLDEVFTDLPARRFTTL
jgi:hypothetical protein